MNEQITNRTVPVLKSIHETAKATGISESLIRQLVAQKKCPGFFSGKKFLVNVNMLIEAIDAESRPTVCKDDEQG